MAASAGCGKRGPESKQCRSRHRTPPLHSPFTNRRLSGQIRIPRITGQPAYSQRLITFDSWLPLCARASSPSPFADRSSRLLRRRSAWKPEIRSCRVGETFLKKAMQFYGRKLSHFLTNSLFSLVSWNPVGDANKINQLAQNPLPYCAGCCRSWQPNGNVLADFVALLVHRRASSSQ